MTKYYSSSLAGYQCTYISLANLLVFKKEHNLAEYVFENADKHPFVNSTFVPLPLMTRYINDVTLGAYVGDMNLMMPEYSGGFSAFFLEGLCSTYKKSKDDPFIKNLCGIIDEEKEKGNIQLNGDIAWNEPSLVVLGRDYPAHVTVELRSRYIDNGKPVQNISYPNLFARINLRRP
ncbi:MAG: hypothetical protein NDI94_01205 [Candidatus Woesearchaeota archaeon]|nr:hypothetical protein [Candidatus Woesearchaeota archaeon]